MTKAQGEWGLFLLVVIALALIPGAWEMVASGFGWMVVGAGVLFWGFILLVGLMTEDKERAREEDEAMKQNPKYWEAFRRGVERAREKRRKEASRP